MKRFAASLRGRITLVTVGVATLAVVATGLIALQLVRSVAEGQAREEIAREATALSRFPAIAGRLEVRERQVLGPDSDLFAVIATGGRPQGTAATYVDAATRQRLLAGERVSETVSRDGRTVLVEGRPLRSGGSIVVARPLDAVNDSVDALLRRILLALIVGLAIAGLAGVLLARRLSRPLTQTAGVARRLAAGERGIAVERPGVTEVDDVAAALVSLDHALATSEHRQREFLLSVSHEIRTPLTAIQGYAEALADGVVPSGQVAATGATVRDESRRLDRFVSDLLLLARLEADDFSVRHSTVDVSALVADARTAWAATARQLQIDLTIETDQSESIVVSSDPMRVRQLLDGLLENALRATPRGGHVVVALMRTQEAAVVAVEDSGPGLSDDDARVAFERGVLHFRYREQRAVGTGLGLSIAARLCERLGGAMRVSRSRFGGARFDLRLPI